MNFTEFKQSLQQAKTNIEEQSKELKGRLLMLEEILAYVEAAEKAEKYEDEKPEEKTKLVENTETDKK